MESFRVSKPKGKFIQGQQVFFCEGIHILAKIFQSFCVLLPNGRLGFNLDQNSRFTRAIDDEINFLIIFGP